MENVVNPGDEGATLRSADTPHHVIVRASRTPLSGTFKTQARCWHFGLLILLFTMYDAATRASIWTSLLPFTAYPTFLLAMIWFLIVLPYYTTPPHQDILIVLAPITIMMIALGLEKVLPHKNTLKFGFFFYAISICNATNYFSKSFAQDFHDACFLIRYCTVPLKQLFKSATFATFGLVAAGPIIIAAALLGAEEIYFYVIKGCCEDTAGYEPFRTAFKTHLKAFGCIFLNIGQAVGQATTQTTTYVGAFVTSVARLLLGEDDNNHESRQPENEASLPPPYSASATLLQQHLPH